jgi:transposase
VREVRRRNWSTEERLRIVRETLEPGVIVQAVADRHGVSTGHIYTWRKQMLATAMAGFVPVEVVPETPQLSAPILAETSARTAAPDIIEITLPSGASIRISDGADAATFRLVLAELGGR